MSAAHANGSFPTPTLDSEAAGILQAVASHGGYAYVRMASQAASSPTAAEAAREMAWEQLHSGPWHSVLPVWRDAYSMSCLHVAQCNYRNREFKDALRVLDLGIIMGGPLLKPDLESAMKLVSAKAKEGQENASGSNSRKLADKADFDEAEVR